MLILTCTASPTGSLNIERVHLFLKIVFIFKFPIMVWIANEVNSKVLQIHQKNFKLSQNASNSHFTWFQIGMCTMCNFDYYFFVLDNLNHFRKCFALISVIVLFLF